jgi:hypothetical protein
MNPKGVGEVSEGIVLAGLLKMGRTVCVPFGNNQSYDLVTEDAGTFVRVQVKTGQLANGRITFDTCSRNTITGVRTGYAGRADVFMIYCPGTGKIYQVPVAECGPRGATLRVDAPANGMRANIRWAADYELTTA